MISKYLEESLYLKIYLNLTKCLFTGKSISHYHTLCTDGVWIWSADLNHYTDNHHFLWPEAFIERMKQNHFLLNEISDEAHDNLDLFLLNDSNEEYRNIKNPDKSLFQYNYFKL